MKEVVAVEGVAVVAAVVEAVEEVVVVEAEAVGRMVHSQWLALH